MILTREDLHKAVWQTVSLAAVAVFALPFRDSVEAHIGTWPMRLIYGAAGMLLAYAVVDLIEGWSLIRTCERQEHEQKEEEKREQAELDREDQKQRTEWDAFTNWVEQNPVTAERLMAMADYEQAEGDPEYRTYLMEKREAEGLDLTRLFNWLKARSDLRKAGLDLPEIDGSS
jgi:hypothetical protein